MGVPPPLFVLSLPGVLLTVDSGVVVLVPVVPIVAARGLVLLVRAFPSGRFFLLVGLHWFVTPFFSAPVPGSVYLCFYSIFLLVVFGLLVLLAVLLLLVVLLLSCRSSVLVLGPRCFCSASFVL